MSVRLLTGDCREMLAAMDAASIDACVTDPPYGLEFMGKAWDSFGGERQAGARGGSGVRGILPGYGRGGTSQDRTTFRLRSALAFQEFSQGWCTEALRILKPGGYLLAFGGTRTYHRLTCAIEDAGFEIRDCLMWLYGCLSEDTEILVDGQWEPYHKATTGRLALCYNSSDDTYSWQPIQDTFRYDICDTAYRIRSDSTDQIVSRNHRCLVERGGAYVFERAEEVARERTARVPVLEDLSGLLAALPVPDQGASHAEPIVLPAVRRSAHQWAASAQADVRTTRHGVRDLCRVRPAGMEGTSLVAARCATDMLSTVQRSVTRAGVGAAWTQGACGLDCQKQGELSREDERRAESCLEGRSDVQAEQGQLHRPEVRQVPGRVYGDGSARRLRDGAPSYRGAADWSSTDENRVGASRRPQHQEQRSVEPDAVRDEPRSQTVRGARYTRADLATIEPVHYDGIVWCVRVPTGAFVARRNGKVFVTGNSGFPKGKGCLKPGWEPIILARKPGPSPWLNIDGCRIETSDDLNGGAYSKNGTDRANGYEDWRFKRTGGAGEFSPPAGRWPANVVLDEEAAALLDEQSGVSTSVGARRAGGASRFFYVAKASTAERSQGNDHPTVKPLALMSWLVKLVTPPGGIVLDPFCGSGSTLIAADRLGFDCIGIDNDPHHIEIARRRLADDAGMFSEVTSSTTGAEAP